MIVPLSFSCSICLEVKEYHQLVMDHNHATSMIRGWTCRPCNLIISKVEQDPQILERIVQYLADPPLKFLQITYKQYKHARNPEPRDRCRQRSNRYYQENREDILSAKRKRLKNDPEFRERRNKINKRTWNKYKDKYNERNRIHRKLLKENING